MRYETATAFRSALEARLLNRSRDTGASIVRLRKLVVFDRLLERLLLIAPDQWMMKGGVALDYRLRERARTTLDLDLVWRAGHVEIARHMVVLQTISLDDFFTFSSTRVSGEDQVGPFRSSRYRVTAELAGRRFEDVLLDVGLDYPDAQPPDLLAGHDLLGFAGIPPTTVPALRLERHLAEKFHAYTRTYQGRRESTRVKDLVDVFLIGTVVRSTAGDVRGALREVFDERQTHSLPTSVPRPPANWRVPLRALAADLDAPSDIDEGHRLIACFLNPLLGMNLEDDMIWDAAEWRWVKADLDVSDDASQSTFREDRS